MDEERNSGVSMDGEPPGDVEGFLERWSRRKSQARHSAVVPEPPQDTPGAPPGPDEAAGAPRTPEVDEPLPPIESLTEDSDYSAFLSPQVSADLRRLALRKLFRSPKFNVCDGLDVYCRDYTQFEPLGDIVTADMRHQIERAAKLAARLAESAPSAGAADGPGAGDQAGADGEPSAEPRQAPSDDDDTRPA